jgi:hypothetical protein
MMNIKRTAEDAAAGEDPDESICRERVPGAEGGALVAQANAK